MNKGFINLVPREKRGCLAKCLAYEVLVFHPDHEYQTTTEDDSKKKIVAKFRDYDDALEFAHEQSLKAYYTRVVLRA